MELFPFRPNWLQRPVSERMEWLTDVITSHNGTEDLTPLRANPRRSLEYDMIATKNAAARLDALLWGWQSQQYLVPIWTDPQRLAAQLSSGAMSIPAATAGYDFSADGYAVLWANDEIHETVLVDTVDAAAINLSAATAQDWPAGTRLYPARPGRLPEVVKRHLHTSQLVQATVRFELDPSPFAAAPGGSLYRGVEVFERPLNWIDGQPEEYHRKVHRLDYALGVVAVDDLSELATTLRTYQTLLVDRADIAAWRGWLHARQGRYAPFWNAQRQWGLEQTASIAAASVLLTVKSLDIMAAYHLDQGRQDIALLHKSGQWYYRRISSVTPSGDDEILTLDSALGIDADPGDFRYITWLMLSRLEADAVEIAWHTAGLAQSAIDIRSKRS